MLHEISVFKFFKGKKILNEKLHLYINTNKNHWMCRKNDGQNVNEIDTQCQYRCSYWGRQKIP